MTWRDAEGRERLCHSLCGGRSNQIDLLDDYAQMIRAALALFEATAEPRFLACAEGWMDRAHDLFWDDSRGGFFFTPAGADDLIIRTRTAHDSATPSGNGVMVANLARLFHLTGRDDYRRAAEATVTAFEVDAIKTFPHGAALLSGFELLAAPILAVIVGETDGPEVAALRRAMAATLVPNLVIQVLANTSALPTAHPAAGKTRIDGNATVYICRGQSCSSPVTTASEVARLVRQPET